MNWGSLHNFIKGKCDQLELLQLGDFLKQDIDLAKTSSSIDVSYTRDGRTIIFT